MVKGLAGPWVGARQYSFYAFKPANALLLILSGLNVIKVAQRLGHSVEVCSPIYLHVIDGMTPQAQAKINAFLAQN